jgi:predicted phage terminase large subunit-like protein
MVARRARSRPFIPAYHVDAICEHLEWVSAGEIQRLIINIGPGYAKSIIVSVMWPAWMWSWRPGWRSIFGSYDGDLSTRDSVRSRTVLTSEWFRDTFKQAWRFTTDQNVKSYYRNNKMGERLATSTTGKGTGFRGHCVAVDDPVNAKDRNNVDLHKSVCDWWDKTMSSRNVDPRLVSRVVIHQRLHKLDLTGHLLKKGGYQHLSLPTEFDPKRRAVTVTRSGATWMDRRTKPRELLFPEFFTPEVVEQAKTDLGTPQFEAQHQQNPQGDEGSIFHREDFKFYRKRDLPPVWQEEIQSWDFAFKKTTDSDFVVGQVWARLAARCYLRFERRGRMGFSESKKAITEISAAWPSAGAKLIEDKANGPAIIDELKESIDGLIAASDPGGVLAQAWAVQPFVEAGNIFIPDPADWPEVEDWLEEVCAYPNGVHDDRVAAFTQAVIRQESYSGTAAAAPTARRTPDDYVPELANPGQADGDLRGDGPGRRRGAHRDRRAPPGDLRRELAARDRRHERRGTEILEFVEDNLYPVLDDMLRWLGGGALQYGFGASSRCTVERSADRELALARQGEARHARGERRIYIRKLAHIRQTSLDVQDRRARTTGAARRRSASSTCSTA